MRLAALTFVGLLVVGCGGPTSPSRPRTVDTLDYVVGPASAWPRQGDQFQHQVVRGSRVWFVKYGRPTMFESWRWDDQFIYHDVDAGLDGDRAGESYKFTDGRWLPRRMRDGEVWSLDLVNNRILWFNSACQRMPSREGMKLDSGEPFFPYRLTARLNGDELLLEYAPHAPNTPPPGNGEFYSFRRGFGWYQWAKDQVVVRFDQLGGPQVSPSGCWS